MLGIILSTHHAICEISHEIEQCAWNIVQISKGQTKTNWHLEVPSQGTWDPIFGQKNLIKINILLLESLKSTILFTYKAIETVRE
jgi:hypothetical protein